LAHTGGSFIPDLQVRWRHECEDCHRSGENHRILPALEDSGVSLLFGSAIRDDFQPHSDADVLVTFAPEAEWGLLEHIAMEEELSEILSRKVDIVNRLAIERSTNWIRRKVILDTAEPYYVAGSCHSIGHAEGGSSGKSFQS
jgi:predicted nucleotidyltransferase